ncbi:MAG: DUF2344 domain-containing protein [Thermoleophilia bacterium]|nr:DUF2344 domain-containing protein [Thermoleophilia bacterium]
MMTIVKNTSRPSEQDIAAESAAAAAAAQELRNHYQLRFSIEGRIRFLSHLETADTLLSAFRRAGVRLALSPGMRPKPLIKVAMPRPVAIEAWNDIVEVELVDAIDPDAFAFALTKVLPRGLILHDVTELSGAYVSAASRVAGATYRITVTGASSDELARAVTQLLAADSVVIERNSPKKRRMVEVRAVLGDLAVIPGEPTVRVHLMLTDAGSCKPEEVVRALAQVSGLDLRTQRMIRESITLAEPGGDGRTVSASLVGADVPDGPDKPWGAC